MRCSLETIDQAIEEKKILTYEPELLENLRDISYCSIPISIIILSNTLCYRHCYAMSMNLTRGMDHYKLVHGNVNYISKNVDYPNHSWIEKDGFVYDTTDGFKWDKDLYYELFKPEICEVYDESNIEDYDYYQHFLSFWEDDSPIEEKALMIQLIELLDIEKPSLNSNTLFEEIKIWRENNNITTKYSDEEMKEYKKFVKENAKKFGINI